MVFCADYSTILGIDKCCMSQLRLRREQFLSPVTVVTGQRRVAMTDGADRAQRLFIGATTRAYWVARMLRTGP